MIDHRDTMHAFTFLLDGTLYALRLDAVERAVPAAALTPLPGAPAIVLGLLDFEGRIVPVVDIRARFRLPGREMGLDDCIIIATTARRTLGILVDMPGEVIDVAEADIDRGTGVLLGSEYIEGVVRLDEGLMLIHDLESFLSLEEEMSIAGAMAEMGGKQRAPACARDRWPGSPRSSKRGSDFDFRRRTAASGSEVAIVDMQLRNGGGLELVHRLSEQRNAPILMAFASADSPLYKQKSIAADAACFFDKDTEQNALTEARRNAGESARPMDTTT